MSTLIKPNTRCKVCNHPGVQAINAALLNQAKYKDIIAKMKAAHPGETELIASNLSRHYKSHVLTQPIMVSRTDGETGEVQQGYLVGHLTPAPEVPKEAIPQKAVPLADALKVIINSGIRNILNHPELVGPKELVAAMEMARKLGLFGNDSEEFADAWAAFGKKRRGRKTTREVTLKETTEEADDDIIDAEPIRPDEAVLPEEWGDDLKLLEGEDGTAE